MAFIAFELFICVDFHGCSEYIFVRISYDIICILLWQLRLCFSENFYGIVCIESEFDMEVKLNMEDL